MLIIWGCKIARGALALRFHSHILQYRHGERSPEGLAGSKNNGVVPATVHPGIRFTPETPKYDNQFRRSSTASAAFAAASCLEAPQKPRADHAGTTAKPKLTFCLDDLMEPSTAASGLLASSLTDFVGAPAEAAQSRKGVEMRIRG